MNILFITPYFLPETGAPQTRLYDLAKRLIKKGHSIEVLTTMPNYPSGIIEPGYRGRFFLKEEIREIPVVRIWSYASPTKGFINRILNYISFSVLAVFAAFRTGKCDVIYVESPPLFTGITGWAVKKIKKAPFLFYVADIWPDAAVEMGLLSKGLLFKLARLLEKFIYKKADKVAAVTKGWVEILKKKGVSADKLEYLPNGVDPEKFKPGTGGEALREKLGLKDKYIALFAGTHGIAQRMDIIVRAAEILKDEKNIHFVFVGDGADKNRICALIKENNVENITLIDAQPLDRMPDWFDLGDCSIITLMKIPLMEGWIPVKLYESLAMTKPVVLGLTGESAGIVLNADAGLTVEPENPEEIANAVKYLAAHPEEAKKMGKNGRKYVAENYSRERTAAHFENVFLNMCT